MEMVAVLLASMESHFKKWFELYLPILIIGFLYLTCYYLIKLRKKKIKNQDSKNLPIIGSLPYVLFNLHRLHDWSVELANTISNTILFKGSAFFGQDIVFTTDPLNVEYILKTNFHNFPKGLVTYEALDLLGQAILTVDSDLWRVHRKMANSVFAAKDFRNMIANVSKRMVEDSLLPLLNHISKEASVVDLQDVFLRYAFDTAVGIVVGRNPRSLSIGFPKNELSGAMNDAMETIFYRYVMPKTWWKFLGWMNLGNEKKNSKARKTMDRYIAHYISLKRDKKDDHEASGDDLLSMYMKIISSTSYDYQQSDEKFLRNTAVTVLIAGRDTITSALTWFFWLICRNPSVEEKILEELKSVLSNKKLNISFKEKKTRGVMFDFEDLKEMVYLESALYESMRLYPPLPLNPKSVLKQDVLPDGTIVKPGMQIMFSNYGLGRMESIWGKDCLEFRPERWIDDDDGKHLKSESKLKYFVFNAGPRTCIGKEVALTEIKLAAAVVLFNFKLKEIEGQDYRAKPSIILQMKNGFKVQIEDRLA